MSVVNPRGAMSVQSLLLDKAMFTRRQAEAWALSHGYRGDAEEGRDYWRLRQEAPTGRVLRTIPFTAGIKAVVQRNPAWRVVRRVPSPSRLRVNPARIIGTIPGTATQIKYHRAGAMPGPYFHDFKPGVKQYALADGSVLLKGKRNLHADDREPDFWTKYGHRRKRSMARRNARRRRRGGQVNWLWVIAGGAALWFLYQQMGGTSPWATSPQTATALAEYRSGEYVA